MKDKEDSYLFDVCLDSPQLAHGPVSKLSAQLQVGGVRGRCGKVELEAQRLVRGQPGRDQPRLRLDVYGSVFKW